MIRTRKKEGNQFLLKVIDCWKKVIDAEKFNLIIVEGLEVSSEEKIPPETLGNVTNRIVAMTTTDVVFFCDDDVTPSLNVIELAKKLELDMRSKGNLAKINAEVIISDMRCKRLHSKSYKPAMGFPLCAIDGKFIRKFKWDPKIMCHEDGVFIDELRLRNKTELLEHNVIGIHYSDDWRAKLLSQAKWYTANARYQSEENLQPKEKPFTEQHLEREAKKIRSKMQTLDRRFAKNYREAMIDGFENYKDYLKNI